MTKPVVPWWDARSGGAGERFTRQVLGLSTHLSTVVGWAVVIVGLIASWGLGNAIGGANVAAPHWFYLVILFAALRFGPLGALVSAIAAGMLAGPLLPAEVASGTMQTVPDWGTRLGFFILIGQAMAFVLIRAVAGVTSELDGLQKEKELLLALERREMFLVYQPIMDLAIEEVVGAEALIRWDHPERGLVSPDEFIPFAEETGVILPIDRWTVHEVGRQLAAWELPPVAGRPLYITVNVSARGFAEADLADRLARVIHEHGLDPGSLGVEVTETGLLADIEGSIEQLAAVAGLGVRLAIDDFGTGYSSLAYVRDLPVDIVKIDMSLIAPMTTDRQSYETVKAAIQFAHAVDRLALAEGVETAEQARALEELGCDLAQGYYFAKPLAAAELFSFIQHRPRRRTPRGPDSDLSVLETPTPQTSSSGVQPG